MYRSNQLKNEEVSEIAKNFLKISFFLKVNERYEELASFMNRYESMEDIITNVSIQKDYLEKEYEARVLLGFMNKQMTNEFAEILRQISDEEFERMVNEEIEGWSN